MKRILADGVRVSRLLPLITRPTIRWYPAAAPRGAGDPTPKDPVRSSKSMLNTDRKKLPKRPQEIPQWQRFYQRKLRIRRLFDPEYSHYRVLKADAGTPLDRWAATHLPHIPAEALPYLCQKRLLYVRASTGMKFKLTLPTKVLEVNQYVCVKKDAAERLERSAQKEKRREERKAKRTPPGRPTTEAVRDWVLYKDECVIVLNKPSGVPVIHGSEDDQTRVVDLLPMLKYDKAEAPLLTSTLDDGASGILVLGRSPNVAHRLSSGWKKPPEGGRSPPTWRRVFWAVVEGQVSTASGTIQCNLAKDPNTARWEVVPDRGLLSSTDFRVRGTGTLKGRPVTWLALYPTTIFPRQLLVHCGTELGCAVLGDTPRGSTAPPTNDPLFLHFRKAVVTNWAGDVRKPILVTAPLPPHMAALFETCRWDPETQEPEVSGKQPKSALRLPRAASHYTPTERHAAPRVARHGPTF